MSCTNLDLLAQRSGLLPHRAAKVYGRSCYARLVVLRLRRRHEELKVPIFQQDDPLFTAPPGVCRPRGAERAPFYYLFQDHFDSYVRVHKERFDVRSGPMRQVDMHSVLQFKDCRHDCFPTARLPSPERFAL